MAKISLARVKDRQFPIVVERDEDGFYVAECHLFEGCYSQGKTLDECLKNIREVIHLCLQEKHTHKAAKLFQPKELSIHTITL